MASPNIFAIEGIDRLGKSTLINGLRSKLGYHEVIHFQKPDLLEYYSQDTFICPLPDYVRDDPKKRAQFQYQYASFMNSMRLADAPGARIIFDRWHLGEVVYSPLYRGYSGDYVFDLEKEHALQGVRLILLTEDFKIARHFVDDQLSLGSVENREKEQDAFIAAFERSNIRDKRLICVTDPATGGFKPKQNVLQEAL